MTTRRPLVLFVHQAAEMYGSDKVLLYIVTGLAARGSIWPVVILPEHGPLFDHLQAAGIEVHVSEIAKVKRSVFSLTGLPRLAARMWCAVGLYDAIVAGRSVVVVHSNTLAVLAGAAWARRRRVPHLWHVHEIILSPRIVSRAFPWLVRWLADRVVSNSTLTERWLVGHQPALAARSHVIFNGLPLQDPASDAAAAAFRARAGAGQRSRLVVLAGRLNHWKGQGLLIDAAGQLHAQGRLANVRFAIVGDAAPGQAHLRDALLAQVAAAGLEAYFFFESFVDDIRPVWQAADLAVVPSTEPEPFGMVAIEAMAAGVPVVVAAHGGLLDIVEDGRSGVLFEPRNALALAEAIGSLLDDAPLRRRLGQAGLQRQRSLFSAESQVVALERLYLEMSRQPPAGPVDDLSFGRC